jgi:hypothetical protein
MRQSPPSYFLVTPSSPSPSPSKILRKPSKTENQDLATVTRLCSTSPPLAARCNSSSPSPSIGNQPQHIQSRTQEDVHPERSTSPSQSPPKILNANALQRPRIASRKGSHQPSKEEVKRARWGTFALLFGMHVVLAGVVGWGFWRNA